MLEDKDIQKLIEILITRDEFNEAISNLANKEDIDKLMKAIDGYAKKVDTFAQEMIILAHKVERLEKWVHQIAKKLGMKLEY